MATALLYLLPTFPNEMVPRWAVHGRNFLKFSGQNFEPADVRINRCVSAILHAQQISISLFYRFVAFLHFFFFGFGFVSSRDKEVGWN